MNMTMLAAALRNAGPQLDAYLRDGRIEGFTRAALAGGVTSAADAVTLARAVEEELAKHRTNSIAALADALASLADAAAAFTAGPPAPAPHPDEPFTDDNWPAPPVPAETRAAVDAATPPVVVEGAPVQCWVCKGWKGVSGSEGLARCGC